MNKNIENLNINKEAFNKSKKFKLYAIGSVMATIALGSALAFGTNTIQNNNQSNYATKKTEFAEIECNFSNYEVLKDYELVAFINEGGDIAAIIRMNANGTSENLTAYLEPDKYYIICETGGKEKRIECEINDAEERYALDIDCSTGEMQMYQAEQSHTLAK